MLRPLPPAPQWHNWSLGPWNRHLLPIALIPVSYEQLISNVIMVTLSREWPIVPQINRACSFSLRGVWPDCSDLFPSVSRDTERPKWPWSPAALNWQKAVCDRGPSRVSWRMQGSPRCCSQQQSSCCWDPCFCCAWCHCCCFCCCCRVVWRLSLHLWLYPCLPPFHLLSLSPACRE